jgi:hypothetical protein
VAQTCPQIETQSKPVLVFASVDCTESELRWQVNEDFYSNEEQYAGSGFGAPLLLL